MDLESFTKFLETRRQTSEEINKTIEFITEFADFLKKVGRTPETCTYNDFQNFSTILMQTQRNTFVNYVNLFRFGSFSNNKELIIGTLEVLDGSEVIENLSKRLTEEFGEEIQNTVFTGIDIPPLGLHPTKKPIITKTLIDNLIANVDPKKGQKFLARGLRNKYTESYKKPRESYLKAKNIDEFLKNQQEDFWQTLTTHYKEGTLFYTQEITKEVLEYIKSQKGMTEAGMRDGDNVIITKIPYMAKHYLAETDKRKRNYYYCHCPWVREALLHEDQPVDPIFCNCSGGYYKNFWEAVLDQEVEIELLESVLKGDDQCKFKLELPKNVKLE